MAGTTPSRSSPGALTLTSGEDAAYAALDWTYVWGECGHQGGETVGSVHVVELESGTAQRVDLPGGMNRIHDMVIARDELVMAPSAENTFLTMPLSPPFEVDTVAAPRTVRSVVRAGDAAFLLLGDGRILRHARGEADVLVDGVTAERLVSAFGQLYALRYEWVTELDPSDGSVVRSFSIPCSIEQAVPTAPSHLVMECGERAVGVLHLATEAFQRQELSSDLGLIAGAEYASVALVSYGSTSDAGTLAVVPAQGLPASDAVTSYGAPLDPLGHLSLFLRNEHALTLLDGSSSVWRLTLSTANGAVGNSEGPDADLSGAAMPLGTAHGLVLLGSASVDDEATLSGRLVELDTFADEVRTIPLEGPPPPHQE